MTDIQCFLAQPLPRVRCDLRRFVFSKNAKCPGPASYHTASVTIGFKDKPIPSMREYENEDNTAVSHDDSRWPTRCTCGYVFQPEDEWQINEHRLYADPENQEFILREAPPGAMWLAPWMRFQASNSPDGKCYVVQTPAGEWCIDGPSKQGSGWTRTGAAPNFTVKPSIAIGEPVHYHAFLTDGVLHEV